MARFNLAALACLIPGLALAQTFTYPGCANLASSDFRHTELARGTGLQEPVAFDLQGVYNTTGDSVTQVNIFFAERTGNVKFYNGATKTTNLVGNLSVWASRGDCGSNDNGLMGIAVDPNYAVNRWIYVWYCPPPAMGANPRLRLSRFTITAQNTFAAASEKILIDLLTSKGDCRHAGGPMTFDGHGDLWVTLGQSGNDINWPSDGSHMDPSDSAKSQEWGPANTASLRGGVFRIHPDNAATTQRNIPSGKYGPGYTVPSGNFGEYWAAQFQSQGNATLAAQYRDPAKVLPEVYAKGSRSNYSIGVHPSKRWAVWGEVNFESGNDEINFISHPAFMGQPYFMANNKPIPFAGKNAATPMNTSPLNNGVQQLPPATPGAINDGGGPMRNVAFAGAFYGYDPALKNRDKLPPHLHNHFFHTSLGGGLWVNTVDTVNVAIARTDPVDNAMMRVPLRSPLSMRIGPDGAFYLLNYDGFYTTGLPAVERMSYAGTCFIQPVPVAKPSRPASDFGVTRTGAGWSVKSVGEHEFGLYALDGRRLLVLSGSGKTEYSFADLRSRAKLEKGVYITQVKSSRGIFTGSMIVY